MINTFIIEGKVVEISKAKTIDNIKCIDVVLDVERLVKDSSPSDTIVIRFTKGLAEIILENVKLGEILSVQGRIQSSDEGYIFIGEKASFLS